MVDIVLGSLIFLLLSTFEALTGPNNGSRGAEAHGNVRRELVRVVGGRGFFELIGGRL